MGQLILTESNARKLYPTAAPEFKQMLIDSFGEKFFSQKVTERIFTLKDACQDQGISYDTVFDGIDDEYEKAEKALKIFAKSMREGKHESECFYYPYFYTSGGGFSYHGYGCGDAVSSFGARLRVDSAEKAKHMGECMLEYYRTYIIGK